MNNRCNICGGEVDYLNGGCALQIAFCRKHSTSLTNVSFCAECYDKWVKEPLSMLNHAAGLELMLDEQEADYEMR